MKRAILITIAASFTLTFANNLDDIKKYNISKHDLNYVAGYEYRKRFDDLNETQKSKIVNTLKKRAFVIQLAQKEHMDKDKEFIEKLKNAKKSIFYTLYMNKKLNSFNISNEEVKKYYKEHIEDYTKVHCFTIVRDKKSDIEKYVEILNNTPKEKRFEKFKELARKYSMHPDRLKGGDLGFIRKQTMARPFGKIAFNLKYDEYNKEPFKTTLGYHLVWVKERKVKLLSEVKKQIVNKLKREKFTKWYANLEVK